MSAARGVGRGALVVFEGVDRCGKTTQTTRLVEALRARAGEVELLRFPDRTTQTGRIIDAYLKQGVELDDRAVHLLFSANRWEAAKRMREKLERGVTLVLDRYAFSGVCFTAAKPGQDVEWCKAPDAGLPAPDVVFFLSLPIEKAMERGQFGEERYEKEAFQRDVLANFQGMASDKWRTLDAAQPVEALGDAILKQTVEVMEACKDKPLGTLWKDA